MKSNKLWKAFSANEDDPRWSVDFHPVYRTVVDISEVWDDRPERRYVPMSEWHYLRRMRFYVVHEPLSPGREHRSFVPHELVFDNSDVWRLRERGRFTTLVPFMPDGYDRSNATLPVRWGPKAFED